MTGSTKKPLFVFFGTPRFAVSVLNALEAHGQTPALVVTAPDRKAGRGMELKPSPAKEWALERGIDVLTPTALRDEQFLAELSNSDWDVFVVAAYAKLIPKELLDMPRTGCLNVHPSLLPKFRGPSPALSTILADERITGVTVMQMNEKMDEGPIVAQARIELLPSQEGEEDPWPPKGSEFEDFLATEGGNLLAETLPEWVAGNITPEAQDESKATYSKKFVDTDALLNLSSNARENFLKIKAFDKSPRAYFRTTEGKRVIVTDAEFENAELKITKVIPEGKKEMTYEDFLRGTAN